MIASVSAFARRKGVQTSNRGYTNHVETWNGECEQIIKGIETDVLPPKKRKRGSHSKLSSSIRSPPPEPLETPNEVNEGICGRTESSSGDIIGGTLDDGFSDSIDETFLKAPVRRLSTILAPKNGVLEDNDNRWTITLHPNENLVILGQYDLWVRSGAVSIAGAALHPSSKLHRVFAPSTHSISPIRCIPNPYGPENPARISILSCKNRMRLLDRIGPRFGRIWNARSHSQEPKRSFSNIFSSADDPYKRPLRRVEPALNWLAMLSRIGTKDQHLKSAMICGPKGSGKSTFCRMLINKSLASSTAKEQLSHETVDDNFVVFMDLDPGQPEYSAPGNISLYKLRSYNLGPPFTHPIPNVDDETVRSHHYGYLSPKEDPDHYFDCALDLFNTYKQIDTGKHPRQLIVNCSGWIQGSGLEILINLIHAFELSEVVYMSSDGPEEVVVTLDQATKKSNTLLHQLTSQPSDTATRTAAELRAMQSLSYFHIDEPERKDLRWKATPLTSTPPLIVYYSGPKQAIAASMVLGDKQDPDFLDTILEGCIVGIVAVDADLIADEEVTNSEIPTRDSVGANPMCEGVDTEICIHDYNHLPIRRNRHGIPYIAPGNHTTPSFPPSQSHCLGQAYIHRIDPATSSFHFYTPIATSSLTRTLQSRHQKIVLVRGKLDTPTWAYAEPFEYEKFRRRRRERILGEKEEFGAQEVRDWAGGQRWAGVVEGGRGRSGRVRRVRRDIR
ncbi:Polynucleotide 5'-hydroxyl-kinase grc3 [Lecanora helva]